MLRIAIQKSGRLSEDSIALLRDAGLKFSNHAGRMLRAEADNFPLEIIYLRDDDIPEYVEGGVVDIGIVGENIVIEKHKKVEQIERLGFGKCSLCVALPRNKTYRNAEDLNGLRIATSYVRVLQNCLDTRGINAEIHEISGAVEIAPSLGLADAIFDIVSTGSTLMANGLKAVDTFLESEALLIGNQQLAGEKREVLERLLFRIQANRNAKSHRYLLMNVPNDRIPQVTALLPGIKSPTLLPLAIPGWSSVHTVVREEVFWSVLESLKAAGAEGILVVPIERMIL